MTPKFNAQPEKPVPTKPKCIEEIYDSVIRNALGLLASEAPAYLAPARKGDSVDRQNGFEFQAKTRSTLAGAENQFNAQPEKPVPTKPNCTEKIYTSAIQNALALLASEAPAYLAPARKGDSVDRQNGFEFQAKTRSTLAGAENQFDAQPEKPVPTKPNCTEKIYTSAIRNALGLLASEAPAYLAPARKGDSVDWQNGFEFQAKTRSTLAGADED